MFLRFPVLILWAIRSNGHPSWIPARLGAPRPSRASQHAGNGDALRDPGTVGLLPRYRKPVTIWASAAFFWFRVIHAGGMISGYARMPASPIIFTLSRLCTLAIGAQSLRGGPGLGIHDQIGNRLGPDFQQLLPARKKSEPLRSSVANDPKSLSSIRSGSHTIIIDVSASRHVGSSLDPPKPH